MRSCSNELAALFIGTRATAEVSSGYVTASPASIFLALDLMSARIGYDRPWPQVILTFSRPLFNHGSREVSSRRVVLLGASTSPAFDICPPLKTLKAQTSAVNVLRVMNPACTLGAQFSQRGAVEVIEYLHFHHCVLLNCRGWP